MRANSHGIVRLHIGALRLRGLLAPAAACASRTRPIWTRVGSLGWLPCRAARFDALDDLTQLALARVFIVFVALSHLFASGHLPLSRVQGAWASVSTFSTISLPICINMLPSHLWMMRSLRQPRG